jgi:hypothetical protein
MMVLRVQGRPWSHRHAVRWRQSETRFPGRFHRAGRAAGGDEPPRGAGRRPGHGLLRAGHGAGRLRTGALGDGDHRRLDLQPARAGQRSPA